MFFKKLCLKLGCLFTAGDMLFVICKKSYQISLIFRFLKAVVVALYKGKALEATFS